MIFYFWNAVWDSHIDDIDFEMFWMFHYCTWLPSIKKTKQSFSIYNQAFNLNIELLHTFKFNVDPNYTFLDIL